MPQATQEVKIEEKPPLKVNMSSLDIIRAAPRVRIIIDEQENHEGSKDVPLGIDGYVINIQRGKEVDIPEPFIQVLENAKYTIIGKADDGQDTERQVPRFNWHRV